MYCVPVSVLLLPSLDVCSDAANAHCKAAQHALQAHPCCSCQLALGQLANLYYSELGLLHSLIKYGTGLKGGKGREQRTHGVY